MVHLLIALLAATPAAAEPPGPGEVRIPVQRYDELLAVRPEAAGRWALSAATASVTVELRQDRPVGVVSVELSLDSDGPAAVPLLPGGVALTAARAGGSPIALSPGAALVYRVDGGGRETLALDYVVDATRSTGGWSLSIPLPPAPSTSLTARLPGDVEPAVIPASGLRVSRDSGGTQLRAEVPAGAGVQIAWRDGDAEGAGLSRASYRGELSGDAVTWTATFGTFGRAESLPILPADVALMDLTVDGRDAAIRVVDGWFVTGLTGRQEVVARFQTPVRRDDGPPGVALRLPRVPVSRFDLVLPGDKAVTATPAASVTRTLKSGRTTASFHTAMTDAVGVTWTEALPEAVAEELRANASLYHAVHADEGVLYLRSFVALEITRGEARQLELDLPPGLLINRVTSDDGAVADWRVQEGRSGRVLQVFLDRAVTEDFVYRVEGEVALARTETPELSVPIPRARGVGRQRGMVALLASKDLTLRPTDETSVNPVGENQLPAFVKQAIELTIAHTFKMAGDDAAIVAQVTEPERADGRFGAQVDTLISLGEVTLDGSASVEIDVKTGSLDNVRLALPPGVNFGGLSAPSLREHKLVDVGGRQFVDVNFTQPLDGRFRLDVRYEQILADAEGELTVPAIAVVGAEVEQGRLAVEALAAVEVSASSVSNLSSVDVSELPRQLVLKTTNPILLAYKYVQADPPWALGLTVTRHRELDVQDATIDRATYRTLVTRDGLAVTTARFVVRNRREQFLRVSLPAGSEVWAASVGGEPSKPALAEGATDADPEVLIKIINSEQGFPVELVYATPVGALGPFGRVKTVLPQPDMVVTESVLDVFLPDGLRYGRARGNMDLESSASPANLSDLGLGESSGALPLKIAVPTTGINYRFSKLYANQGGRAAAVGIPYLSAWGARAAVSGTLLGTVLFWLGLGAALWPATRSGWRRWLGGAGVGAALAAAGMAWLDVASTGPVVASAALLLVAGGGAGWRLRRDRIEQRAEDGEGPGDGDEAPAARAYRGDEGAEADEPSDDSAGEPSDSAV